LASAVLPLAPPPPILVRARSLVLKAIGVSTEAIPDMAVLQRASSVPIGGGSGDGADRARSSAPASPEQPQASPAAPPPSPRDPPPEAPVEEASGEGPAEAALGASASDAASVLLLEENQATTGHTELEVALREVLSTSAEVPEKVCQEVPVEAETKVSLAFGEDPPPKPNAEPRPGTCAVCLEDKASTSPLCWNCRCDARFCPDCIQGFAEEAVSKALYAVPRLRCPSCATRVPTSAWAKHAGSSHAQYLSNSDALLSFRCSECHEVGSLETDAEEFQAPKPSKVAEKVEACKDAWRDFCLAETSPEALLDALATQDDSKAFKEVLQHIGDVERRTCLHLAWLRKNPFISTPCCLTEYCFRCKVATHHDGQSCEQRQSEELDILCQFCPQCEVPTVRAEGCDHIVCVCGSEWTWQEVQQAGQALGPPSYLKNLLETGALDPKWRNPDNGMTLLMYAVMNDRLENLNMLIDAGADVKAQDSTGRSVLLYALGIANANPRLALAKLFVEKSVELSREDISTWVASGASTSPAAVPTLQWMLQTAGCGDEDLKGAFGGALLSTAMNAGRERMLRHFLPLSPVPRLAAFQLLAASLRNLELFDKVLDASGLGVDDLDDDGKSLVEVAMQHNKQDLVNHLVLKREAKTTLAILARPVGFWPNREVIPKELFSTLVQRGADIWEAMPDGGDDSRGFILDLVLKSGAFAEPAVGPQARPYAVPRRVPPGTKAWASELVQTMLGQWGEAADLFARSPAGGAMLTEAVALKEWSLADALLIGKASLDARDAKGNAPLHLAVAAQNLKMVQDLMQAGADPMATRKSDGATPLSLAAADCWAEGLNAMQDFMGRSGDGSLCNVGIRLHAAVCCPQCCQRFDTKRAQEVHWRFMHDPSRHQEM